MKESFDEDFDVIVIGAGHAGCEAASASARQFEGRLHAAGDPSSFACGRSRVIRLCCRGSRRLRTLIKGRFRT